MKIGVIVSVMVLLPVSARADADSLTDSLGPRALGLGEALRASAVGSSATIMNPAGAALVRGNYVLEGTYGFGPEDDATSAAISVCDSTTRVPACLYYNYFSAAPPMNGERSLHEIGLTTAFPLGDKLLIGTTSKYIDYEETVTEAVMPADHSRDGDFLVDGGLIIRASQALNLALVGYNIVGHDKDNFPRAIGTGAAFYATPKLMFAADARWNLDADGSPGRYGAGAELFLVSQGGQAGFPLRGGYVYDDATGASYVGGGGGYVTPRVAVDVGIRKQVSEGDELMVQLGLRLFMPN